MKFYRACVLVGLVAALFFIGCGQQKLPQRKQARVIRLFDVFQPEDLSGKVPPKSEIVKSTIKHDGKGYLIIPDAPGIGIELAPDAAEKHPYRMRWVGTRLHADGSVIDQ